MKLTEAITITALHRLEFENAVQLLRFRNLITAAEATTALTALAADERAGVIVEAQFFLTFDSRQRKLAIAEGLTVGPQ